MAVENNLTTVIPLIFTQGLNALRSNLIMPNMVTNDFSAEVKEKGEVINIPLPSVSSTTPVVPAAYAPDPANIAPTTAPIMLDNWEEAAFTLTEKEYAQITAGIVPIQLSSAVEALAQAINGSILANYTSVGNTIGTPGTTPFQMSAGIAAATGAGTILTNWLAPMSDRKLALSPEAYGTALGLPNFAYYQYAGDKDAVDQGIIKRKFGFDWAQDQQIPTQMAGTLTGTVTANGAQMAGSTAVSIGAGTSSSFAPKLGDIITFAGDMQTYAIQAGGQLAIGPLAAGTTGAYNIFPAKQVALAGGEAVTLTGNHVVNLAFHRQAFGFASRPLALPIGHNPDMTMMIPDPVSGVTMRLIIREEYHRTRVAYDVLWGTAPIRNQLAVRIFG